MGAVARGNLVVEPTRYVGRAASASPATGLASRHKYEQEALVSEALRFG